MEMDLDDYILERSCGFIDDEHALLNPAGEEFFQWYQGQLRRGIRWRQEEKSTAPRPRKEKRPRQPWLTGMSKWRRAGDNQVKWWDYLRQDVRDNPTCLLNEEFRHKFRVTYCIFDRIVDALKGSGLVQDPRVPKPGAPPIPAEMKVLHILRMLAVGAQYDAFEEASGCAGKTIQALCIKPASSQTKGFYDWFVDHFYDEWVRPPDQEETKAELAYAAEIGMPGMIGQMDAVHLAWDACPAGASGEHAGKEGYPTKAFNAVCSSRRLFYSCSRAYPGTVNDKTMVKSDEFIRALKEDPLYSDYQYTVFDRLGAESKLKGLYVTVDGGYLRWPETLDGYKSPRNDDETLYQMHQGSVRKDVECAFGILKKRFRMLRLPFLVRDAIDIEKIFKTCMIIHNMLLIDDGLSSIGDLDGDWLNDDVNAFLEMNRGPRSFGFGGVQHRETAETDFTRVGSRYEDHHGNPDDDPVAPGYDAKKRVLLDHFMYCRNHNKINWPLKAAQVRPRDVGADPPSRGVVAA